MEMYTVIDVEAGKSVYIQYVLTVVAADINNAVRLNLLKDNRQQYAADTETLKTLPSRFKTRLRLRRLSRLIRDCICLYSVYQNSFRLLPLFR